jgi:hypothetical protein
MKAVNKYIVLDVHKDTPVIAVFDDDREDGPRIYGTISSDSRILRATTNR